MQQLSGSLDEVPRIWKVARQAADIKSWLVKKLVGDENGLLPNTTLMMPREIPPYWTNPPIIMMAPYPGLTSPQHLPLLQNSKPRIGYALHHAYRNRCGGNSSSAPVNVTVMDTIAPIAKSQGHHRTIGC